MRCNLQLAEYESLLNTVDSGTKQTKETIKQFLANVNRAGQEKVGITSIHLVH